MNITRMPVRNILLTVVVACAFIIDARTAPASAADLPGNAAPPFPPPVAAPRAGNGDCPRLRAGCPVPRAGTDGRTPAGRPTPETRLHVS